MLRKESSEPFEDASAALMRLFGAHDDDYVFAKDREFRYLFVNEAYASFLGMRPEEIVGRHDSDFWQPETLLGDPKDGLPGFRASDEEAFAGRIVREHLSGKRGENVRIYETTKVPLYDGKGEIRGVLIRARDVTAAMRAEEALRTSETRYRLLVEHAPVSVYVHDGQKVLFANRTFAALMGVADPEELVGFPLASIVHADDAAMVRRRVRDLEEGKVATPIILGRIVAKDGRHVPVEVMATRCVFADRPAFQVVAIDVSERQRAEMERAGLERQLRHAQRMDALGTLAGGIAHDFNNMLAVILSNTQLACAVLPAEHAAQASLSEVMVATRRAGDLVRRILSFSRNEPQRRALLRPADVVEEVVRLLNSTLPAAITIEVVVAGEPPDIFGDATQIHQALMNLCTNAWQSMVPGRRGHIRVSIEAVELDDAGARVHTDLTAGRYVCVSVQDDGSGIDAATLERIFDPFFTTKKIGEGTGLGLSVVHGVMKGHGGAVTVETEPGRGTTFRLYFPVDLRPETPTSSPPRSQSMPGGGRRVLLLDDEPALARGVKQLLKRLGYRVSVFDSAEAALEALRAGPEQFDLVLTDFNMRGHSGLEVARAVTALRKELPVLLVSGFLSDDVRRAAAEAGVRGLLSKPFSVEELSALVDELALR